MQKLKTCLYHSNINNNFDDAIDVIQDWLHGKIDSKTYQKYIENYNQQQLLTTNNKNTNNNKIKSSQNKKSVSYDNNIKLNIKFNSFPVAVISDIVRSMGMDGMPNFPVVKRLNANELSRYCDKVSHLLII